MLPPKPSRVTASPDGYAAPAGPIAERLAWDPDAQSIEGLLLAVKGLAFQILFDHHIGDHADIGFETVVLAWGAGDPFMTALTGDLGIHVNVHLVLNRQLDQFLAGVLPDLDQGRISSATRTEGLGGIDGVLDAVSRQMRRKTSATVRAGFAFLLLMVVLRAGRRIGGVIARRVGLCFGLFKATAAVVGRPDRHWEQAFVGAKAQMILSNGGVNMSAYAANLTPAEMDALVAFQQSRKSQRP